MCHFFRNLVLLKNIIIPGIVLLKGKKHAKEKNLDFLFVFTELVVH